MSASFRTAHNIVSNHETICQHTYCRKGLLYFQTMLLQSILFFLSLLFLSISTKLKLIQREREMEDSGRRERSPQFTVKGKRRRKRKERRWRRQNRKLFCGSLSQRKTTRDTHTCTTTINIILGYFFSATISKCAFNCHKAPSLSPVGI